MEYKLSIQNTANARKAAAGKAKPRIREKIVKANDEAELQIEKEKFMREYERGWFRRLYCDYQITYTRIS